MIPPSMPTQIFSDADMEKFWGYVSWFLTINQPWIMMGVAILLAAGVVSIIIYIFTQNRHDPDDEEEYF